MKNKEDFKRTRPKYETEEHLEKERDFADCLANKWSTYTWEKADMKMGFDYWVYDDNRALRAVCEIKIRNIFSTSYTSILISKRKFEGIRTLCDLWGYNPTNNIHQNPLLPVYGIFAFRFLDGDFYYRYTLKELEEQKAKGQIWEEEGGGRTKQTRDKWDKEDIVHIARELLIPIDVKFKSGIVHGRRSRKFCEYKKKEYEIKD